MTLATELNRRLASPTFAEDADGVSRLLSDLSGKLIVHLAAEDTVLYPKLFSATDAITRDMARSFADEMGAIAQTFRSYVARWGSAAAIRHKPHDFAKETGDILNALKDRVRRENTQLYPQADKQG
jgi:hypothetical protein